MRSILCNIAYNFTVSVSVTPLDRNAISFNSRALMVSIKQRAKNYSKTKEKICICETNITE